MNVLDRNSIKSLGQVVDVEELTFLKSLESHAPLYLKCRAKCWSILEYLLHKSLIWLTVRQFNNIVFSSEVSTLHKFVYTDEALLLVRQ